MMPRTRVLAFRILFLTSLPLLQHVDGAETFELRRGEHVSYIGNTLADRMQHHAWLETYIHALHPQLDLTFRNLGFSADEVVIRPRSNNFGSPDDWLTKTEADVVFCFFGYNEAHKGSEGLQGFRDELSALIDGMRAQKSNGESAPRLVIFSPIAHEDHKSPHLPDGSANNKNLALYSLTMADVCDAKGVRFVDLFTPTQALYSKAAKPLTLNGIHLLDHGNQALAKVIMAELFGDAGRVTKSDDELKLLRDAVLERNYYWFSRYRVVDGYNVFGGRSKLNWHGQSNADVMQREMEIFDVMTANRDERVWAAARGYELAIDDSNVPELLAVKTNKPGELEGEAHPYFGGVEAIEKMTIAEGMQVNLFASEEMFPEMINPVQMAVDTDGRLFVSVWPSYPHWNPTEPRTDRIVCLPDENADGVADDCVIFADKLNSITGFEFWGGGMLVAAPPEIWFLQDTNGDDQADVQIRMLQGLSSADTHHTANALVVGPGGWLYWSRGIFNTASMETPTGTYRSGASGVHRFNPRTFEMEFHFPIGPNPHGDVFDQWGFHFVNDGTGGTGSYANIGKGRGYKKWFKKRVRPVAATGILSSSHFPEANDGNFLICNTIGFLGVLQHEVKYNGADIRAEEVEPILFSSDPNFRPTDVEVGGDGALYVSDWCNVLIGHMQHNMRDPNRDREHGRVYRVTAKGRPLVKRVKLRGKPIQEVCQAFFAQENSTRYRARLELSGRDREEVTAAVAAWAEKLSPEKADEAQALLECLWVFEEQRLPDLALLAKVYRAAEPRVRAAAIRTLGHWAGRVAEWEPLLAAAARDDAALVRAEAVKAAVEFDGFAAAEIVFDVGTRPTDPELDFVLAYARSELNVDELARDAIGSGREPSAAARAYMLLYAAVEDLVKLLGPSESVYRAILSREDVPRELLRDAVIALADLSDSSRIGLLLELIQGRAQEKRTDGVAELGELVSEQPGTELGKWLGPIEALALKGSSVAARRAGYAAWIATEGSADNAFLAASQARERLEDFLGAVPSVHDQRLRAGLYTKVLPLIAELPTQLEGESGSRVVASGLRVDFFEPHASDAKIETFAKLVPKASGVVPQISLDVPQRQANDRYGLRFSGALQIPTSGTYHFFTNSDDGSRLYIGGRQVVNNDGPHGAVERRGKIELPAGSQEIVVTFWEGGGSERLQVMWQGPGFKKRPIPPDRFTVRGSETLHDFAIRALASIPGRERDKFVQLAALVKAGKSRESAISALSGIASEDWEPKEVPVLADNLLGYLSAMPASYRTAAPALEAIMLARSLSDRLPQEQGDALRARLENLDVRVIAVGTVPQRMIFDKERIAVEAGKPVEFRFSNTDEMPHNFAITEPGALEEVGLQSEATARAPDAAARQYIPKSKKILLASRLLQPGEIQALSFDVPETPGIYPYVCTYPGHWRRMYGALYVVADLAAYQGDPEGYLAAHPLPFKDELLEFNTRGREWNFADLEAAVNPLSGGRAFDVGKALFKVSSCVSCHRLNHEGQVFGPDLAKLEPKKQTAAFVLRSILEPSKDIEDKFRSYSFVLASGNVVSGMIVEENSAQVHIVIDPLAKGKPTVLQKSEILGRAVLPHSMMPEGLLNRLSREEILDLTAYVLAGGDKKHKLFAGHAHH
jgi:putative heme-binding domain-containing protein